MYKAILDEIKKYDSIVIFGHVNPDGDCFGSEIALRETLRKTFPEKAVFAVGSGLQRFFKLLGRLDAVPEDVIERSLAIIVDGNDIPRMEDQRIKKAKAFIKFDHHVDSGTFTEGPSLVREEACSCCEIILDFIRDNNFVINKNIAEALLLGITTDTARFQFVKDYVKTYSDAAYLCEQGARPEMINNILNLTNEDSAVFKGYVYTHYQKTKNGVLYLKFTQKQLKKLKLTSNAAGSMVNLISNIRGYPIWTFICENHDESYHIEVRSNGPKVQPIALKYGGGGHALAAGTTIQKDELHLIDEFLNDLDLLAKDYKETKF